MREISAYQLASCGGDSVTTVDVARNGLELPFQDLGEISMAAVEARLTVFILPVDVALPPDDFVDDFVGVPTGGVFAGPADSLTSFA